MMSIHGLTAQLRWVLTMLVSDVWMNANTSASE